LELLMRLSRSSVLMLLPSLGAVFLTGCASPPPPPPAPPAIVPATADQAADLQAQIAKAFPNARVGHVSAVDLSTGTLAVGGIAVGDVRKGDSIQFRDSRINPIANGEVIDQNSDNPSYPFLIVQYEPTNPGRVPVKGDLAVYLPRKP
jgi:hypothetical protein